MKNENKVIMYVDGGICSQLFRYAKGQWFARKGYDVLYDLTWFEDCGKDMLGKRDFPFELQEMFPSLNINVADREQVSFYKYNYSSEYIVKDTEDLKPPLYVNMYDRDEMLGDSEYDLYRELFQWEQLYDALGNQAKEINRDIENNNETGLITIGVHVRRGDMAIYDGLWPVLSSEYFKKAIAQANEITQQQGKKCKLYFFSDGFDFVKEEIAPYLKNDYQLIDYNFKDYEDLYLLSKCQIQIASQGSFGKMAYCFNDSENRKLIVPGYQRIRGMNDKDKANIIKIPMDDSMYISKGYLGELDDKKSKIREAYNSIVHALDRAKNSGAKLAIFPFGDNGRIYNRILHETFNYEPIIFDNNPSYKGTEILPLYEIAGIKESQKIVLLMTIKRDDLKKMVYNYLSKNEVLE